MNVQMTQALVKGHEGLRLKVYPDSKGYPTIGWGFNLSDPYARAICNATGLDLAALMTGTAVLTVDQAERVFQLQFHNAVMESATLFPDIYTMPDNAAAVIVDMMFEMGPTRFKGFKDMIAAVKQKDWPQMIAEMKDSKWQIEVPHRSENDEALIAAIAA